MSSEQVQGKIASGRTNRSYFALERLSNPIRLCEIPFPTPYQRKCLKWINCKKAETETSYISGTHNASQKVHSMFFECFKKGEASKKEWLISFSQQIDPSKDDRCHLALTVLISFSPYEHFVWILFFYLLIFFNAINTHFSFAIERISSFAFTNRNLRSVLTKRYTPDTWNILPQCSLQGATEKLHQLVIPRKNLLSR